MTLSILDIIVFSAGGIIVGLYAFFSIKRFKKFKQAFKKYIDQGKSKEEAKALATREIYKKKKKTTQNVKEDVIFKE